MAKLMPRARRSRSGIIVAGGRIVDSSGAGSGGNTNAICGAGCCDRDDRLGVGFEARAGGFVRRAGDFVRRVVGLVQRVGWFFSRVGIFARWPVSSSGRPCRSGSSAEGCGASVGSGTAGPPPGSGRVEAGSGWSAVTGRMVISSVPPPEGDPLAGGNTSVGASLVPEPGRESHTDGSPARGMATRGSGPLLVPGTRRGRDVGLSGGSGASGRDASCCCDASLLSASSATRMRRTTSSGNAAGPTGLVSCPLPGTCCLSRGTRRGRGAGLSSATGQPPEARRRRPISGR
jgi:hypothetical protein